MWQPFQSGRMGECWDWRSTCRWATEKTRREKARRVWLRQRMSPGHRANSKDWRSLLHHFSLCPLMWVFQLILSILYECLSARHLTFIQQTRKNPPLSERSRSQDKEFWREMRADAATPNLKGREEPVAPRLPVHMKYSATLRPVSGVHFSSLSLSLLFSLPARLEQMHPSDCRQALVFSFTRFTLKNGNIVIHYPMDMSLTPSSCNPTAFTVCTWKSYATKHTLRCRCNLVSISSNASLQLLAIDANTYASFCFHVTRDALLVLLPVL